MVTGDRSRRVSRLSGGPRLGRRANTVESIISSAPGFSYPGGKVGLRSWLIPMMPKSGSLYVEPFVGRGGMFWAACQVLSYSRFWINDTATYRFFNAVKAVNLKQLPSQLLQVNKKQLVDGIRRGDPLSIVLEPWCFYHGKALSAGEGSYIGGVLDHYNPVVAYHTLSTCRSILNHYDVAITSKSFEALPWADWDGGVFVYVDPPYVDRDLRYEGIDHEMLLGLLLSTKARWLLSGYNSELYTARLGRPVGTREVTAGFGAGKVRRVECIWASPLLNT